MDFTSFNDSISEDGSGKFLKLEFNIFNTLIYG